MAVQMESAEEDGRSMSEKKIGRKEGLKQETKSCRSLRLGVLARLAERPPRPQAIATQTWKPKQSPRKTQSSDNTQSNYKHV